MKNWTMIFTLIYHWESRHWRIRLTLYFASVLQKLYCTSLHACYGNLDSEGCYYNLLGFSPSSKYLLKNLVIYEKNLLYISTNNHESWKSRNSQTQLQNLLWFKKEEEFLPFGWGLWKAHTTAEIAKKVMPRLVRPPKICKVKILFLIHTIFFQISLGLEFVFKICNWQDVIFLVQLQIINGSGP